jgi:hypothetical protein
MNNFKITIHLIKPIPNPHPLESEWFPLLANIYGYKTSCFDGYVSGVEYLDKSLVIYCYLVEDNENMEKLAPFKKRYSDWVGYQKICIIDALKIHMRVLGYNASTVEITAL